MVIRQSWNGASHDHATRTTKGSTELGAAPRVGTSPRPRPAALRARAVCGSAEDRRRGHRACGRPARPVEATRSRHALRLVGSLYDRRAGWPGGAPTWRLFADPALTRKPVPTAPLQCAEPSPTPPPA